MKKFKTINLLVLIFAIALLFAVGCTDSGTTI